MLLGRSASHSACAKNVGTRISPGSYRGLPAFQESRASASTPFGARNTGGTSPAPTGSLAKFASAHASNHPSGMRSAFLLSGTPVVHRALTPSRLTVRYAPSLGPVAATVGGSRIHSVRFSPLTDR